LTGNKRTRKSKPSKINLLSNDQLDNSNGNGNGHGNIYASEPKRQRKAGTVDLPVRETIKNFKGMERLKLIISIGNQAPSEMASMTTAAQNFMNKTYKPVQRCLESHFEGNHEAFVECWSANFPYSRFNEKCKSLPTDKCRLWISIKISNS
jgi:hypothetical protein